MQKDNYGIGFYWNNKDEAVGLNMAYGGEIHFMTYEEAILKCESVQRRYASDNNTMEPRTRIYKIFKLIEVLE